MDKCMLFSRMVWMGFTSVRNCSRVYLQAAQDHPFQGDHSPLVCFEQEVSDCARKNPNEPRQGVKCSRVRLNWTKQGWCKHDLRLTFFLSSVRCETSHFHTVRKVWKCASCFYFSYKTDVHHWTSLLPGCWQGCELKSQTGRQQGRFYHHLV